MATTYTARFRRRTVDSGADHHAHWVSDGVRRQERVAGIMVVGVITESSLREIERERMSK